MKKVWLDEMTWEEAEQAFEETDIGLICIGATHPHGVAAPLGTDTFVAYGLGERILKKCDVIAVPTIAIGHNKYHMDFPGCITVRRCVLTDYLYDICESLAKWGIKKIMWNSPHGGNVSSIEDVAYQIRYDYGILSARATYGIAGHIYSELAGYGSEGLVDETSMMLYLRPDTAHPGRAIFKEFKNILGPSLPVTGRSVRFRDTDVYVYFTSKDRSDTCGYSASPKAIDMSNCSRELGERIIETAADYTAAFIEEFRKVKVPLNEKAKRITELPST